MEKIKQKPENIEKLTEVEEYMNTIPNELQKINKDINSSMEVYDITEEFKYKFSEEDIKKKWQVYGGTKDITE